MDTKPCPICKSKPIIKHYLTKEGYDFGYSIWCPLFYVGDGIHGVTESSGLENHWSIYFLETEDEAIKEWNRKVKEWKA